MSFRGLWHYFDFLLAIPIAIYLWCAKYLDRAEKCGSSPDGTCFYVVKDFKKQCRWCGKTEVPHRGG